MNHNLTRGLPGVVPCGDNQGARGMTERTFRSLQAKADALRQAMDIKSVDFGHDEASGEFFVRLSGKPGDGVGNYHATFPTVGALHHYFNDKIKLFGR